MNGPTDVLSPKSIKGLDGSARIGGASTCVTSSRPSARSSLSESSRRNGASTIVHSQRYSVTRSAGTDPGLGSRGQSHSCSTRTKTFRARFSKACDYEAIYLQINDLRQRGRLTTTVNGTYLSRAELQPAPGSKRFSYRWRILAHVIHTDQFAQRNRANFSIFYDGPADTWFLGGVDVRACFTGSAKIEEDDNLDLGVDMTAEHRSPKRRELTLPLVWTVHMRGKSRIGPRST